GGVVEIESASERATTFAVYLPRVDAEADTLEPIEADGEVSGSGTVLAVEDEPMSRRLVRGMLERCGYSVLEAADGTEAIQIADAYAGEIDLVVTDMMMPKMRGPELVQHLRAKRPEIRVLFVSGYADSTEVGGEGTGFLAKPFSHAQLRDKARSLLAKEA
ncbi:MAG: response regulator, partial [bacterium]|nr:response regulator [bacterium]